MVRGKPVIGLLTVLCLSRSFYSQTISTRTMSNFTGLHSVAYVTVPNETVGKTLAQ